MKQLRALIWLGIIASAWASCAPQEPAWTYQGLAGPTAWATLDPQYALCGQGRRQSPINIEEVLPRDLPNIRFRYGSTLVRLRNTGRNIEQEVQSGNTISLGNVRYELQSLRFHSPSEHRAAGQEFPLEVQWTHKNTQGQAANVAVMVKVGRENSALKSLLQRLPTAAGDVVETSAAIALNKLLPTQRTYMRYSGSHTGPPCHENVIWFVLTEPLEASAQQIAILNRVYRNNVRPTRPIGKRTVFLDATP